MKCARKRPLLANLWDHRRMINRLLPNIKLWLAMMSVQPQQLHGNKSQNKREDIV